MATEQDYKTDYQADGLFLVRGATLNKIGMLLKRQRSKGVGSITCAESPDGTTISDNGSGGGGYDGPDLTGFTLQTYEFCEGGKTVTRLVPVGPVIS